MKGWKEQSSFSGAQSKNAREREYERSRKMKRERPWGFYEVLNSGRGYKIKYVEVAPHKRLSLQKHKQRSEHWVIIEGEAKITLGREEFFRHANQSAYIPMEGMHRLENPQDEPLHLIEVQCGWYLEEDDIQRFDDDHGRSCEEK
ncbi:MAG: cupin domain-containing protein [Candidatus Omnitrophica bacterium]|nr:cupin domain-containing protein [Candidatus Omnitrophota bacterium]